MSFNKISRSKQVTPKLKIEMYGAKGSWKTTSALESEGPILLIDREKGSQTYGIAYDFDPYEVDPNNVKELMQFGELLNGLNTALQQVNAARSQMGDADYYGRLKQLVDFYAAPPYNLPEHTHESFARGEFHWKTIIVDSGTMIYADLVEYYRNLYGKGSDTFRLEPKDYSPIKKQWYKFIDNLIALPCHVIMTAHRTENRKPRIENGKMNYMAIDPDQPWKADLEKKNDHVFDVVIHMDYDLKSGDHWATIEKSRIIDKDKKPILPPRIDKLDSRTFIPYLIALAKDGKGIDVPKSSTSNIARLNAQFETLLNDALQNARLLQWTDQKIVTVFKQTTGYGTPDELRNDANCEAKITAFLEATRAVIESQSSDVSADDTGFEGV